MSGFDRGDYVKLSDLHRELREKFNYIRDAEKHAMIERWEDASTLKNIGRSGVTKFTGDCEEFALVSLDKARAMGFHARLVLCQVETGEHHAICEVASPDYQEAYFFDNRVLKILVLNELKHYTFKTVSPWDPEPSDPRPWLKVKR
jgi:predicted transglutaminase-like cysteine proteinase